MFFHRLNGKCQLKKLVLALTLFSFLFLLGCSQQSRLVTQIGDCKLKILSTEPKSPAILKPGQKVHINFKYDMGDYDAVQIWARPRTNGSSTRGYRAHGSSVYNKYDSAKDTIQGYFFFDEPTEVDEIIVRMKDSKSGGYVCVAKKKVDFKWFGYSKPKEAEAKKTCPDKQLDSKRVRIEVDNPEGDSGWKDEYEFWLKPRFDLHENYGLNGWKPFAVEASEEKPEGFPELPEFKHDMQRFLTFELGNTKENVFYGVADFDKPEEEYFPFDLYVDTDRNGELEEIGELEERDGGGGRPDTFRIWVPYKDDDSDQYAIYLWSYLKKGPGDPGFSYFVKSARYALFRANKKVIQVLLMDNTGNGNFNDESDRIVLDWDLDGMIECEDKNGMRPLYEPFGIGGEIYRVTECDPRGRRMVLRKQEPQTLSAQIRDDGERSKEDSCGKSF